MTCTRKKERAINVIFLNAKIADFQTTLNELENSYQFLSLKYDKVVSQTQSESVKFLLT